MTYIKWTCTECGDIVISNTHRRHEMNMCKCGKSGCDAEEGYTRMMGSYKFIKSYDYNFFDELVYNMNEQELLEFCGCHPQPPRIYVTLPEVVFIKTLEDEILEDLK